MHYHRRLPMIIVAILAVKDKIIFERHQEWGQPAEVSLGAGPLKIGVS